MDYRSLAEQLVKKCLQKGADAAEVWIEAGRNLSVEVRNGEIETVQEASTQGVGLRVFVQKRMAFASSNVLTEEAMADAAARAVEFARRTTADESNLLPEKSPHHDVPGLYDPEIARIPLEKKIDLALQVEKLAMKDGRISKSAGASYGEGEQTVVIANSRGVLKSYQASGCGYGLAVVAEKGEQKTTGSDSCSRRCFADLKPPALLAAKAAKDALDMLDPHPLKTQRAAIIFDPEVAYAVLGGILAAIDGERVLQGASFLAAKLNQKVASELVTLIDDGIMPKGMASAPFDGEGVNTQKRTVMEKGVLKGFLYNTIAAARAGLKSTGNGSRGGFTSLPGIGPHNFYMAAGESNRADILAATKTGLLVKEVTGYGINPVNGGFSGGASGFWIENGKIAFPVQGITIAGSAEEILLGIDRVGNDLDLNQTLTSPTFRVKELQIGGE